MFVILIESILKVHLLCSGVSIPKFFMILADVVSTRPNQSHPPVLMVEHMIFGAPKHSPTGITDIKLSPRIKGRRTTDQIGVPATEIEAHETSHTEPGCSPMSSIADGPQSLIDMGNQFQEIGAEIFLPIDRNVPRPAAVKPCVVFSQISVNTDYDDFVVLNVINDLGNSVGSVVIVFQRVTIAMTMKVIDDRIRLPACVIALWEEQAIISVLVEDL